MNFAISPSLEQRTLIRISIALWSLNDIRTLIAEFYIPPSDLKQKLKKWQLVEDKVLEKILKIQFSESLKKKLSHVIQPIGLEVLRWKEYHEQFLYEKDLIVDSLNKICWTSHGTVDLKKTAEILIKNDSLDIINCYQLACIYCLESYIPVLWRKIPYHFRKLFYSVSNPEKIKQQELVLFWTYYINGKVGRLNYLLKGSYARTIYQYIFLCAAFSGNKVATAYFLQKLSIQESEESLKRTAECVGMKRYGRAFKDTDFPREYYADVLCFLFLHTNRQDQYKMCYSVNVLQCFLDWPWQDFITKIVYFYVSWPFFDKRKYDVLLQRIIKKVIDGYKDYNYQKLFGYFWTQSSIDHKKYVIRECNYSRLISKLFRVKDRENITSVLQIATVEEKEKLIFCENGKDICTRLVMQNKWNLLRFFMDECLSSKTVLNRFKVELTLQLYAYINDEDKLLKCIQLLDNIKKEADEVDRNVCQAKKLCK